MRVGNNPEKIRNEKNILKKHRVVVVFYVPDSDEAFFSELDKVLDKCLESLIRTINPETTNITLINNGSAPKVIPVVEKYKAHLDKYVVYAENKGKVYAVLDEVRGIHEEFVTISDSDILFYDGWENAVFEIYQNHPKAGVVSPHPCPYLTFYYNRSVFFKNTLLGNIAYGKYVSDEDIDLYIKGTNLPKIIDRKNAAFNWRQKQFILKNPTPAIIGAYHVVATYRTEQFRNSYTFPEIKFRNSYEEGFIDYLADSKGMYRLSTIESYIYHMGNTMDDICMSHQNTDSKMLSTGIFKNISIFSPESRLRVFVKRNAGRLLIKLKWS